VNLLLIDIGNTRLKWATSTAADFTPGGWCYSTETGVEQLFNGSFSTIEVDRVVLANVAQPSLVQVIRRLIGQQWGMEVEELKSAKLACGVTNAYSDPAGLGVDRWAAMIGAYALTQGAVCVVDCGTAMTIDVIDQQGRHIGGLILPGYKLMQQAIMQRGAQLSDVTENETHPEVMQFGRNTTQCIVQGSLLACKAVIEQALAQAELDCGGRVSLIITGGDAELIRSALVCQSRFEPELVLQGLSVLARERPREISA